MATTFASPRANHFASARGPIGPPPSVAIRFESRGRQATISKRISNPPDARLPTASRPMRRPTVLFSWVLIATPVLAADVPDDWAFKPVRRTGVPAVRTPAASPIDAFLLQKLEAAGLAYTPPADKATLLRRVTFDLTGLPPTLAELEAFLADNSPTAFEKVVDRLLASPALRRAAGPALARPGAVRRDRRLQGRRPPAARLAVPRLRDPVVQRRQAVRPLHQGATRRRRAVPDRPGRPDRHRVPAALPGRVQRGQPGAAAAGDPQRRHRHDRAGVPRHHARLRQVPRPQVRPDHATGLLPPPGVLRGLEGGRGPAPAAPRSGTDSTASSASGRRRRPTSAGRSRRSSGRIKEAFSQKRRSRFPEELARLLDIPPEKRTPLEQQIAAMVVKQVYADDKGDVQRHEAAREGAVGGPQEAACRRRTEADHRRRSRWPSPTSARMSRRPTC